MTAPRRHTNSLECEKKGFEKKRSFEAGSKNDEAAIANASEKLFIHDYNNIIIIKIAADKIFKIESATQNVKTLGYTPKKILSKKSFLRLLPIKEAAAFKKLLGKFSKSHEEIFESELTLLDPKGRSIKLNAFIECVRDLKNKPAKWLLHLTKFSDRDALENEFNIPLRILSQLPDSVFLTDTNGIILKWFGGSADIFGYSKAEALGKHASFVFAPEIRKELMLRVFKDLQLKNEFKGEILCAKKDGSFVPIESSIKVIFGKDGSPIAMIGINKDITEKKIKDQALKESEAKFSELSVLINEIIWVMEDKSITFISPSFEKLFGISREKLYSNPTVIFNKIYHEDYERIAKRYSVENFSVNPISEEELRIIVKDDIRWFRIRTYPLNGSGKKFKFIGIAEDITERKKADLELKNSENLLRTVFNAIPELLTVHDRDFNIVLSNWKGIKKNPPRANAALKCYKTYLNREEPCENCPAKQVFSTGLPLSKETINQKTGKIKEVNIFPIFNESGETIMIAESVKDITNKRYAEEALKESEEKYRSVYENSTVGIYRTTPDGKLLMSNPALVKMLGYPSLEALKNTDVARIGYKDKQIRNLFKKILEERGFINDFEMEWLTYNGDSVFFTESARAVKNKNGETLYYEGVVVDITERKKSKNQLVKQTSQLRGVAKIMNSLLRTDNFDNALEEALKILCETFNADRSYIFEKRLDQLTRKPFLRRISEWVLPEVIPYKNLDYNRSFKFDFASSENFSALISGEVVHGPIENYSPFEKKVLGKYGIKSAFFAPIMINNSFWGAFCIDDVRSPREWTDFEEAMIKFAVQGISGAIERETVKRELIIAKEKAEESHRLKSEFLAQMSHEIRTPLNTILSFSHAAKNEIGEKLSPELNRTFADIEQAGDRIIRTMDSILKMAEIQTGVYNIKVERLDVYEDVLKSLFEQFKKLAKKKNINFLLNRKIENTVIAGDEPTINQIFLNIIDNAIKFTVKGKVEINIDRDVSRRLFVSVIDTGIGITNNFKQNLFKPFFQEDQGYSRSYEGNGLGLALVKKYCELNNALINVESSKNVGSIFTITFSE